MAVASPFERIKREGGQWFLFGKPVFRTQKTKRTGSGRPEPMRLEQAYCLAYLFALFLLFCRRFWLPVF